MRSFALTTFALLASAGAQPVVAAEEALDEDDALPIGPATPGSGSILTALGIALMLVLAWVSVQYV